MKHVDSCRVVFSLPLIQTQQVSLLIAESIKSRSVISSTLHKTVQYGLTFYNNKLKQTKFDKYFYDCLKLC